MPSAPARESALPASFAAVVTDVFAGARDADLTASKVAERATRALERLSVHLAQLVGELGIHALMARSAALSSTAIPWLANTIPTVAPTDARPWASLEAAMASRDPQEISDGFSTLLSNFVWLLGRLIGEGLVAHLLRDAWPEVPPPGGKESP
jgi:hypothetical protein